MKVRSYLSMFRMASARVQVGEAALTLIGAALLGPSPSSAELTHGYRSDRILIQPRAGITLERLRDLHARCGTKVAHCFQNIGGLQVLELPAGAEVPSVVGAYHSSGLVEFAEPDYLVHAFETPNDPKYVDGTLWGLNRIRAPEGWSVQNSASNIVVAVVDTGVRYTHQDLAANMWVNPEDGGHGFNLLKGTADPNDDNGHGTIVAGVLGAVGNNALGVVGVAWRVQIMACKTFDSFQMGSVSGCIAGLDYARTNHARIINASWGFATNSLAMSNAVFSLREDGIILVAASGNNSANLDVNPVYPACYPLDNVVSVAYTMRDDSLAAPSNYGSTNVHLAAPGDQIYSTFGATDSFYLTQSGSSFAAPYVSGTLALLLAKYPEETARQTIARLLNGVDPVLSLAGKCLTAGRLNLAGALNPPIRLTPLGLTAGGLFQLRVAANANRLFVVQSSTSLVDWRSLSTNSTGADGTLEFTDGEATGFRWRYYRAMAQP
ncbi:MAG TPA: S8 family peptidase [Verrucomicrobiae bacterium]